MIKYKFDGFYSANVEIDAKWNEIGDVMNYLVSLAGKFGIDPIEAARRKS